MRELCWAVNRIVTIRRLFSQLWIFALIATVGQRLSRKVRRVFAVSGRRAALTRARGAARAPATRISSATRRAALSRVARKTPMFLLTALVFPGVLAVLCLGAGLLVDRASGSFLPAALVPALGLA